MTRAVLALGSNLGDRHAHLRGAVEYFGKWLVAASSVYETPPWGDADQPAYLNAVLLVDDATAAPADWLTRALDAERAAGRERDPQRRFGPRTLDVDVITVDAVATDDAELTLPHPRAHLRAFVLLPWVEMEPDARLPGHGAVADLLLTPVVVADTEGVRRRDDLPLADFLSE